MEDLEEIAENNDEKEPRNRYSEGFQDGFDRGMLASVIIGILFLGAYKIMPYIPKINISCFLKVLLAKCALLAGLASVCIVLVHDISLFCCAIFPEFVIIIYSLSTNIFSRFLNA